MLGLARERVLTESISALSRENASTLRERVSNRRDPKLHGRKPTNQAAECEPGSRMSWKALDPENPEKVLLNPGESIGLRAM